MSRLSAHIIASYGSLFPQPRVSLGSGSLGHNDMRKNVQKKMCEKHNKAGFSRFGGLKIHTHTHKFIYVLINTSELCQLCQEKSDNDNDRNKIDGQKVVSGHQRLV